MPRDMTPDQARQIIEGLSKSISRWGLTSPFRTIGKRLRTDFVGTVSKSRNPNGTPWEKTAQKPLAKLGERATMLLENGQIVTQTIRTKKGKQAVKRFRQKKGPPLERLKAIHRGGKFGTKKRIAEFLNTPGRALRFSKWTLDYGYTPGTAWVEKLQFGGTIKGKKVPERRILELTRTQRKFIGKTIGAFVDKKLDQLARR